MATFTDRLRILLEADTKNAETGFKRFTTSIKEADTVSGKFKAGWSSAMDSLKANAGMAAAAAGTALLAFAVKAVGAFTETAKAAIDFGKAAGFSVEEASRWIAVADDFQISAEGISSATARISRSLDDEKWARYGIATRDAGGNARSTNDIFLDVLDTLGKISNPTERSAAAFQMLGKGWQTIAPLIGKTRAEYEQMLASVEDGLVITAEEARTAERMRLAQDALGDALNDVTLAVGKQVAEMAPLIEQMTELATIGAWLTDKGVFQPPGTQDWGETTEVLRGWVEEAYNSGDAIQYLVDKGLSVDTATQLMLGYQPAIEAAGEAAATANDNGMKALADTLERQADAAKRAADHLFDLESAELNLMSSSDALAQQELETNLILLDPKRSAQEKRDALIALREAQIGTAEDAKTVAEAFAEAHGAADGSTASYGLQIQKLEELKEKYPALTSDINLMIAALDAIPDVKNIDINVNYNYKHHGNPSVLGGVTPLDGKRAAGGPVNPGGAYLVGEDGPEILQMGNAAGNIIPNGARLGGSNHYTVIVQHSGLADEYTIEQAVLRAVQGLQRDGYL